MRTLKRHVFPIILLIALVAAGGVPSAAQESVGGSPLTADGSAVDTDENAEAADEGADGEARKGGQDSRVRAKLVVDCKSKKSKHSDNKKVRKFCDRKGDDGKKDRNAVSAQGSNQQTLNCGIINFSVADIGGGEAQFTVWGESTLGPVLGGIWGIEWWNNNTGAAGTPNGTIAPSPGNPRVFFDSRAANTGRGRVKAAFTGNVLTKGGLCFILPPVTAEETVLR